MSKMPISASRPADGGLGHAVVVRRGDEVGADQPVGRPAADPEGQEQRPEGPARLTSRRVGQREPVAAPGPARSTGGSTYDAGRAVGHLAHVGGPVAQHQQHHRHEQQREDRHQPGRPAPARAVGQVGDGRQEDQLAGGARRREEAGDQAAVAHEPAVGHDRAEHQGHRAGADADRRRPRGTTAARPTSSPGSARRPAATSASASATTRRMPNRSISAAANGAVRP